MLKVLHKFTVFFVFFSAFIISDALAAGYSCPTYKRYTSCSYGYYMTSSSSSTTCNTTPTAGNACRPCSAAGTGFSCSGGTSCPSKTCSAGYYLPANSSTCTQCPSGYYCVGGTFPKSSSVQGRTVCSSSTPFSPEGTQESGGCGRLLHIGSDTLYLRSGKKTTPSLNILIDGKQFYGSLNTYINSNFKINSGSTTYSLYDDSVYSTGVAIDLGNVNPENQCSTGSPNDVYSSIGKNCLTTKYYSFVGASGFYCVSFCTSCPSGYSLTLDRCVITDSGGFCEKSGFYDGMDDVSSKYQRILVPTCVR